MRTGHRIQNEVSRIGDQKEERHKKTKMVTLVGWWDGWGSWKLGNNDG